MPIVVSRWQHSVASIPKFVILLHNFEQIPNIKEIVQLLKKSE